MAATADITMTAPFGPGDTATSTVFNNCRRLNYQFDREVVEIIDENGKTITFDFETIATITHTISGEVSTVAITT